MTSSKLDEDHEKILWTMGKVAKQLSVSTKTVSRLVQKGKLPSIRFGRNVRIEKQAVYHFIELTYLDVELRIRVLNEKASLVDKSNF